jgi:hypothetical protein
MRGQVHTTEDRSHRSRFPGPRKGLKRKARSREAAKTCSGKPGFFGQGPKKCARIFGFRVTKGQLAVTGTGGEVRDLANDTYYVDNGWGLVNTERDPARDQQYRREYEWDERNQLKVSADSRYRVSYTYGQDGERSGKYGVPMSGGSGNAGVPGTNFSMGHFDVLG